MADSSVSPDMSIASQAYELARQNAADARQKSGQHVKLMSKAEAATALSPVAASAAAAPTDSVQSAAPPSVQTKSVTNNEAPNLPDPTGPVATPNNALRVVKGSDLFASGGDNVFAALEAMSDARQKDSNNAQLIKRAQSALQISAKVQEFKDKQSEIKGNEKSAVTGLVSSFAGVLLAYKVSRLGTATASEGGTATKLASDSLEKPAANDTSAMSDKQSSQRHQNDEKAKSDIADHGAGKASSDASPSSDEDAERKVEVKANRDSFYRNIGQSVPGVVDAVHKAFDVGTASGGQYQANQASLAQKMDNIQATIAQTNVDSASAWVDAAKDSRKAAQQAILTHITMWGDAVNNVFK